MRVGIQDNAERPGNLRERARQAIIRLEKLQVLARDAAGLAPASSDRAIEVARSARGLLNGALLGEGPATILESVAYGEQAVRTSSEILSRSMNRPIALRAEETGLGAPDPVYHHGLEREILRRSPGEQVTVSDLLSALRRTGQGIIDENALDIALFRMAAAESPLVTFSLRRDPDAYRDVGVVGWEVLPPPLRRLEDHLLLEIKEARVFARQVLDSVILDADEDEILEWDHVVTESRSLSDLLSSSPLSESDQAILATKAADLAGMLRENAESDGSRKREWGIVSEKMSIVTGTIEARFPLPEEEGPAPS